MRIIGLRYSVSMSDRGDSNARPLRPERSALPTALHPDFVCSYVLKANAKVALFIGIKNFFKEKYKKSCTVTNKVLPLHPQTRKMVP